MMGSEVINGSALPQEVSSYKLNNQALIPASLLTTIAGVLIKDLLIHLMTKCPHSYQKTMKITYLLHVHILTIKIIY